LVLGVVIVVSTMVAFAVSGVAFGVVFVVLV
jgi:hypothetical protein